VARGHVPTTAVAATIVGGLQAQEAIKLLHGQPALLGEGLHLEGLSGDVSRVAYPRREDCLGHDRLSEVRPLGLGVSDVSLASLLQRAEEALGKGAVLDLSRDIVHRLTCPECGGSQPGGVVLGAVSESQAPCPKCGTHRIVDIVSSVDREGDVNLDQTPAALGVPPYDIIVARRGLEAEQAWLFDGDAPSVLGPLYPSRNEGERRYA